MGQPVLPNLDPIAARGSGAVEGSLLQAAFLSTYVPRRCGIATFTRDLIAGIRASLDGDGGERLVPPPRARHPPRAGPPRPACPTCPSWIPSPSSTASGWQAATSSSASGC